MAGTQQPPAQQDASKAPPATTALDNLQAMMNLVLISSGRFLKEHQAGGQSGRMQFALQRAVPVAAERFHDSLDELENEIHQAQTVLRRDLALLKADRKKREAAAKQQEAEKARLAAESSAKKNAPVQKEQPPADAQPQPAQPEAATAKDQPVKTEAEPEALERKEDKIPPPIETTSEPQPERDPLFDGTPTTANPQDTEFDFDAMFGDSVMDTSNENQGDVNMDASGPDLNFTLEDSGPSELLRGLEDFAKSGDDDGAGEQTSTNLDLDFAMPDLSDLNANTAANTSSDQPSTSKPAESTAQKPATNAEDPSLLDTVMTNDDLDDLFNIGDYENPEETQFDDAFFGFGEN